MSVENDDKENKEGKTVTVPPPKKNNEFLSAMESVMRLAMAGFGGALAGLAISKQGHHTSRRPYVDSNLPVSWAIACISFAGIIESSRLLSPFSYLGLKQPYLTTIGDHTLGGAIAGAVFRGMQIQSGKSKSPILAPRIMAGLIPGVTLGLLAGCLQATVDTLETILNDEQANAAAQLEIERIKASLTGSKQQKDEETEPHQK